MTWNPDRIPDQTGRTIAVTGATAGIGYFAAEQLARAGANVVLASRSADKLEVAQATLRLQVPGASLESVVIDMTSLDSIARASDALAATPRLEGILLNAGVMTAVSGAKTVDGLPVMMASHAIGNFALVSRLLPALAHASEGSYARIVHTSTGFVRRFRMSVDNLTHTPWPSIAAYTQAKTATEVYAFELDRRLRAAGLPVSSLVTHPGVGVDAKTPLRPGIRDATTPYQRNPYTPWAQGKDAAAWSAVRALTDPSATGGEYYAPREGIRGLPVSIAPLPRTAAPEPGVSAGVWEQLERLSGTHVLA
ncbi:SDR family NAD(P)-dependent oxidoreductase [Paramicrobacterium chengjingii]|uniref:SDR family NAD(P)-dependent oxidoreductase n=1 Tax=Paramicrobacterium chengjingii TaxID=2769067 RepID=A0ABX6YIS8_9MICO|nr:SDR family NAD(P)-dependent oxidoreductase [Microbacterium chengjingii]QPZ38661.1 SDR family NAD(P)-dependent oxidoreductase [Microbacterium chengjingii]